MVELGASTILNKRARPDANCSPDRRKSSSPKPEKGFRGAWVPGGKGDVAVAELGKRKGAASRPGAGKRCKITGLKIMAADVDNLGDLTILLS